jgi:P-type Ca2+ transporter type 2C
MQLIGAALVLTLLVTSISPLQRIFDTVALTSSQWGICLIGPIVYVAIAEVVKWFDRRSAQSEPALVPAEAAGR